jgi:hypothetical protein
MSAVSVTLSSTRHIIQSDSSELLTALHQYDLPICVAEMGLGLINFNERDELGIACFCKNMAKTIYVNTEKQYVYIGDDYQEPNSALIEYTEEIPTIFTNSFFQRWDLTHQLLFDFNYIGFNGKPVFCIKGLWVIDKWHHLDITPGSKIILVSPKRLAS